MLHYLPYVGTYCPDLLSLPPPISVPTARKAARPDLYRSFIHSDHHQPPKPSFTPCFFQLIPHAFREKTVKQYLTTMATDSVRLRTAKSYIAFFATLDSSLLSPLLSDETFTHVMAPASLAIPALSKAEFLAHSAGLGRIMSGFPVFAKEYLECESGNSVVVWATSRTNFREEVKLGEEGGWEYEGEYVFMLTMDASGKKVVRVVEVLDSLKTERDLIPLMSRAKSRAAALEGNGGARN